MTESGGDEYAVSVLTAFRTLVRNICSRRGVRIAKWLGDGAMLVGVETTPLLATVLEIEFAAERSPERFDIRCGVTAGDVILHEGDDYIGHAVNVAARLCDLANGGHVLGTPAVVDELPLWGAVLNTDDIVVRGLENKLRVMRIGFKALHGTAVPDPVCGIPLTKEVATISTKDSLGREMWFCSDSCRDTWERRPEPPADELGSPRRPLIGY